MLNVYSCQLALLEVTIKWFNVKAKLVVWFIGLIMHQPPEEDLPNVCEPQWTGGMAGVIMEIEFFTF